MAAATTPRPSSTTEAAAAAAVLADIDLSKFGPDEDNASVVTADDSDNNLSSNSRMNYFGEWRNEVDDRSIRRQMMIHMYKLLTSTSPRQSSGRLKRKLPALIRLIEAAHYRVSPTKQAYSDTTNLKERVKKLAIAFHYEMRKQGKRTFHVPEKISRRPLTTTLRLNEEPLGVVVRSVRQA